MLCSAGNPRTNQERDILPQILNIHGIKIKVLTLSDKSNFWDTFTSKLTKKRNRIAHHGEFATVAEAYLAIECAEVLWSKVVLEVGKKLGFELDDGEPWSNGIEDSYDPKDPF